MTANALQQAQNVRRPSRDAMLIRHPSVQTFWLRHKGIFENAWKEWEAKDRHGQISLDRCPYDSELQEAVDRSWQDPSQENAVKALWNEVFPKVYKAQFFDPARLRTLRDYLDCVSDAGIPLRPPYGIVLNRGGAMLDPRSEGYLAAPQFQSFYRDLLDHFMRPIARLLFPDIYGSDTQTFGFSIQWQAGKDTDLRMHTDASAVTLNINLNLPGETCSGSAVRFFDPKTQEANSLIFEPGTALIHHGSVPHASESITSGERHNLVLSLYGKGGQIPHHSGVGMPVNPRERWTIPHVLSDGFAPF